MDEESKPETYKETYQRIQKLNPAQKIVLAQKGTPTERKILATNATLDVLLALIKSPKINEGEIAHIAALASTPEAALKAIYSSSRWLKSSRVRSACLKNPRIPQAMTVRLLSAYSKQQLRNLIRDPSVPAATKEHAKKRLAGRR